MVGAVSEGAREGNPASAAPGGEGAAFSQMPLPRQMPDDFTSMWTLMNKINKQNRKRLVETQSRLAVAGGGLGRVRWAQGLGSPGWKLGSSPGETARS